MKKKLRNIKCRIIALWWFMTRRNYYLLSYHDRRGETLETYNIVLPELIVWLQKKHGYMTSHEIIKDLEEIANACDDKLAQYQIFSLITKLKKK